MSAPTTARPLETPDAAKISECAVLNSALWRPDTLTEADFLNPGDFLNPDGGAIWETMREMRAEGAPIDPETVTQRLLALGKYAEVQIAFADAIHTGGDAAHGLHHARVLKVASLDRQIRAAAATGTHERLESLVAERRAFLDSSDREKTLHDARAVQMATMDAIEANIARAAAGQIAGIRTGFPKLDALTGGWIPAELTIVGARPSAGKSSLGLGFGHEALKAGIHVLIFSLEMPREICGMRLVSMESGVPFTAIRNGTLTPEQLKRCVAAAELLRAMPLHIDTTPALTVEQFRDTVARVTGAADIGLVLVDYVGLMRSPGAESRRVEMGRVSAEMKATAMRHNLPVIAAAQLNRDAAGKRPELHDLKESGDLEQDADNVLLIDRSIGDADGDLLLAKARNGEANVAIPVAFDGPTMSFSQKDF